MRARVRAFARARWLRGGDGKGGPAWASGANRQMGCVHGVICKGCVRGQPGCEVGAAGLRGRGRVERSYFALGSGVVLCVMCLRTLVPTFKAQSFLSS